MGVTSLTPGLPLIQKTKRTLKIRQRRVSRTKKGSGKRKKRAAEVAKLHSKVFNRRNAYQWQVANKLVKKADAVVVEDLNIQGMVRRSSFVLCLMSYGRGGFCS